MSDAFSIAKSGLHTQEVYIEKLANDLANLNTQNYKQSRVVFSDATFKAITPHSDTPQAIGLGAKVVSSYVDFNQGPLVASEQWNDVAINGHGFFQVEDEEGRVFYTRHSSFMINEERYLATSDGYRLSDNIQIPEDAIEIEIRKNGEVLAYVANDKEPMRLGQINLAKFINQEHLTVHPNGLYENNEQMESPSFDTPGQNGLGVLLQKHYEGSNVDMVTSLMHLTMAQRIYQLNAKAIQIADEMEKVTNEMYR